MTSSASSRKNCKQALYAAIERVNTFTAIFALCTSILGIMYTLILKSNKQMSKTTIFFIVIKDVS